MTAVQHAVPVGDRLPTAPGRRTWPARWLPAVALVGLTLASLACNLVGFGDATNQRNNAVRRAALAHEISARGPADEVLVDFGFLEWRDNLGFSGGRTVWLNPVARAEFLAQRDPRRTYIYLHTPVDAGDSVHIEVERGGPEARTSRRLVLHPTADGWLVTADEALP